MVYVTTRSSSPRAHPTADSTRSARDARDERKSQRLQRQGCQEDPGHEGGDEEARGCEETRRFRWLRLPVGRRDELDPSRRGVHRGVQVLTSVQETR